MYLVSVNDFADTTCFIMSSPKPRGKRGRDYDAAGSSAELPDVTALRTYVDKEDEQIRAKAKALLNSQLITQTEAMAALEARLEPIETYEEALGSGIVSELRTELRKNFKLGNQLETWLNTYVPPLASGGNTGISAEVQDGIYQHVHALSAGTADALHRMLAFEKEYCVQRTKVTDEVTWQRYKSVLESNMLFDLTRTAMQVHGDLLNMASTILSNLQHLKTGDGEKLIATMY